jgi:hypothetical protein
MFVPMSGLTVCLLNLINSIWNNEEFPDQWKVHDIVPAYKKGDKTDINNFLETSLSPTS